MSESSDVQTAPADSPGTPQDQPEAEAEAEAGGTTIVLTAITEYACYSPGSLQECWAVTSLKAPLYEPSARASVDIVAVIDKSGSMRGQKIALVRETLLFVIDQLKETDRISLVVYDSDVELVFGLMKMTEQNRERARTYVSSIKDGSSTNLSGGLLKGMEQVALTNGGEKSQVQSVLLLTDGLANHGITNKAGIIDQMKKMQNEGLGAVVSLSSDRSTSSRVAGHRNPFAIFNRGNLQQQNAAPPPAFQVPFQQQQQQQYAAPPPPAFQVPVQQQQQPAPPLPPPFQQQAPPPPVQQQAAPPPPPPVQQQAAPPPPPPVQQQAAPPPPPPVQHLVGPPPPPPPPVARSTVEPATAGYKFDGTVYTFGFGSDHDADMLEAISTQGGGVYYYIDTNEKIPESFADCLGGLLSVMGQNVSVKLVTHDDITFKKVHTTKPINWTTPNKSCEVAMGDIQSEEGRDLVLELELPPVPASEHVPLVSVELSYFNVITSQFDTVQCQLTTNRTDGERGSGNITVDMQRNRVMSADALQKAEALGNQNQLIEAHGLLRTTIATLQASASRDEGLVKLLVLDLNKCLETMKTKESFKSHGKNYIRSKMQSHAVQRSNFVSDEEDEELEEYAYGNKSKKAYRSKAKSRK